MKQHGAFWSNVQAQRIRSFAWLTMSLYYSLFPIHIIHRLIYSFVQKIPFTVYANNCFIDDMQITIHHGIRAWQIVIKKQCFADGWNIFCQQNLIRKDNIILFRIQEPYTFDAIPFGESQSHTLMRCTSALQILTTYRMVQPGKQSVDF